ncbi:MJ0042-type zinc finger domain-containing protein [Blastopirellula retiformator]|uniref:Zinc finger/thioredoxin putative domain-containing protein n=1 Tax=Blastopirellula retiformator TaxID=2527970 RepID=A0A5C5VJ01_9BACT|nr:MJ0042-type zinc finger domain-containing protein [Blastopirellula retiformator]TWT38548.1 hypothetical protein Enr8_02410 [Blastopirellula retiformator]
MPIEFACSQCSTKFRVPDPLAGKMVRCPKCQSAERVPQPAAKPAPEPELRLRETNNGPWREEPLPAVAAAAVPPPESLSLVEVRHRISTPGTALFFVAILAMTVNTVSVVVWTLQLMFAPPANLTAVGAAFSMLFGGLTVGVTAVMMKGLIHFRTLHNRVWAWIGLVLAMTPCGASLFCVLGIPFAIWGIVLLADRRISSHFRR